VTISGVTEPILSQRVVDQVIRLREGEASILGGIQDKQDQSSWTGIPGLSSIPILKYLFGSKDRTINDDELVFLVVPHIVRTQSLDRVNLRTIDTGAGATVELRHISAAAPDASTPTPAPAVPAHQPAEARPSLGVVPGQSALSAAPAALAQLSASADVNGQTAAAAVANPAAMTPNPAAASPPAMPPVPPGFGTQPGPGQPNTSGAPRPPVPMGPGNVNLTLNPPGAPVAAGSTFQVPVVLSGGKDIFSVPLQVQYDPAKLSLTNVTLGDLLGRDNQAVGLVHRDDGPGNITINASRPPGVAGVNGAGVVCVLSFQAKAAGTADLTLTKAAAINSAQQQLPAPGSRITITVH
jgi:general secretion pathway protein D